MLTLKKVVAVVVVPLLPVLVCFFAAGADGGTFAGASCCWCAHSLRAVHRRREPRRSCLQHLHLDGGGPPGDAARGPESGTP